MSANRFEYEISEFILQLYAIPGFRNIDHLVGTYVRCGESSEAFSKLIALRSYKHQGHLALRCLFSAYPIFDGAPIDRKGLNGVQVRIRPLLYLKPQYVAL